MLLRTVASEHFKIIAPMTNALKSGDRRKIYKYNDLRPLEDCAQQALQAAQLRLEPEVSAVPAPAIVSTPAELGIETLVTKLMELGLVEDIAQRMAATAQAEHPGASLLELISRFCGTIYHPSIGGDFAPPCDARRAILFGVFLPIPATPRVMESEWIVYGRDNCGLPPQRICAPSGWTTRISMFPVYMPFLLAKGGQWTCDLSGKPPVYQSRQCHKTQLCNYAKTRAIVEPAVIAPKVREALSGHWRKA